MKWRKNIKLNLLIIIITVLSFTALLSARLISADEQLSPQPEATESQTAASTQSETVSNNGSVGSSMRTTASAASAFSAETVDISAPYACLYNATTDEILYEKSIDEKIHPASLTKILTAITALDYTDSDTIITVGTELELLPEHSSLCLIKKGHRLTLYDLLTGMLVSSGNDAAYTVAVNVVRQVMDRDDISNKDAVSYFTDMMNFTARFIGCTSSSFTTPDGFDDEEQYTTVRDLVKICDYALGIKEIGDITSTEKKKVVFESGENITWSNSNQLLHKESPYYYPDAVGMKTGTTPLAGKCLAAVAHISSQTYIAVVAGCRSEDERYSSVREMFESVD